jgi:hypothetical protein
MQADRTRLPGRYGYGYLPGRLAFMLADRIRGASAATRKIAHNWIFRCSFGFSHEIMA